MLLRTTASSMDGFNGGMAECPIVDFCRAQREPQTDKSKVASYSLRSGHMRSDETNLSGGGRDRRPEKAMCQGGSVKEKFMHPQLIYSNVYTNLLIFFLLLFRVRLSIINLANMPLALIYRCRSRQTFRPPRRLPPPPSIPPRRSIVGCPPRTASRVVQTSVRRCRPGSGLLAITCTADTGSTMPLRCSAH